MRISEIDNTRTERSIETKTRPDEIISKDYSPKLEILSLSLPRESPIVEDLLVKTRIFNDFKKTKCSRFVNSHNKNIYIKIIVNISI